MVRVPRAPPRERPNLDRFCCVFRCEIGVPMRLPTRVPKSLYCCLLIAATASNCFALTAICQAQVRADEIRTKGGIVCQPFTKAPVTYSLSQLGTFGVPRLSEHDLRVARIVRQFSRSQRLRFVFIHHRTEFLIYDAVDGPCNNPNGGYSVLNEGCNVYYQPNQTPESTNPAPGCYGASRPKELNVLHSDHEM